MLLCNMVSGKVDCDEVIATASLLHLMCRRQCAIAIAECDSMTV